MDGRGEIPKYQLARLSGRADVHDVVAFLRQAQRDGYEAAELDSARQPRPPRTKAACSSSPSKIRPGSRGGPPQGSFPRPGRRAQHRQAVPWPSREHRLRRPREHGRHAAGRGQLPVTGPLSAAGSVLGWSCPSVGAKWEPRSAFSCGQKLPDAVTVAV
jgi:hypothetical protein